MRRIGCVLVEYSLWSKLLSARVILHLRNGKRPIVLVLELAQSNSSLPMNNSEVLESQKWPDHGCKSAEGSPVSLELAQPPPQTES